MGAWCDLCDTYHYDRFLTDHLTTIFGVTMTAPTVQSLVDQINGLTSQVTALKQDSDLSPIADAVDALNSALNPAPVDPTPAPAVTLYEHIGQDGVDSSLFTQDGSTPDGQPVYTFTGDPSTVDASQWSVYTPAPSVIQ